jgi:hypothetical protein
MSTKSREVIYGGRIIGAKIRAEGARKRAAEAIREADRAETEARSIQMEGYGGPAQPSPTIAQCLNGGYGWLEVECHRCETRESPPLDAIPRPRDTPIWKLEAALKCRSCKEAVSFPHTDDDSDYNDHNRYGHPTLDLSAKDAECLNEDMQGLPPLGLASFYLQMIAPPLLPLDASKCAVRAACRATRPLWKALDRWKRLGLGLASMAALPGR